MVRRPHGRDTRERLGLVEHDPDEPAVDPFGARSLERVLPDVVLRLILHEALEPHDVERRVTRGHVGAEVEDPRLDPARFARRDRANRMLLARGHDRVPEIGATGPVEEVDLEALGRQTSPCG